MSATKPQNLLSNGCGQPLAAWLRQEARGSLTWRKRAMINYSSFWFERFLEKQRVPAGPAPTVRFVMGFWRSGTTLLHNMLHEKFECTTPTTWQCLNPSTCFIRDAPSRDTQIDRPMDGGLIRLFGPQEDEFATLLLGEPSLYRGFFLPDLLPSLLADQIRSQLRHERWLNFILQIASQGGGAPVLLKSPNHFLRLGLLSDLFPDHKYLWVVRDFRQVYVSNLRMWTAMAETHALADWSPDTISRFLIEAMRSYRNVIASLQVGRPDCIFMPFSTLVEAPDDAVTRAAKFLGLKPRQGNTAFATPTQPLPVLHHRESWLPSEAGDLIEEIDVLHATLLSSTLG